MPGFITDAIGLLLLLPPSRALARRVALRNRRSRWLNRAVELRQLELVDPAARQRRRTRAAYDADSTAADIDDPQLESMSAMRLRNSAPIAVFGDLDADLWGSHRR